MVETITDVIQRQPAATPTTKATTVVEEFEESDPFEEPTIKKSKSDVMYIFNYLIDDYVSSKDEVTACDALLYIHNNTQFREQVKDLIKLIGDNDAQNLMSYYNEDIHGDRCNYQDIGEFINRISTYNEY